MPDPIRPSVRDRAETSRRAASGGATLVLLGAAMLLAGCGSVVTPFPTYPKQPPFGVSDPRPRVAVCYNGLKTSTEEIQQLAQEQCIGDAVAERIDTDYRLDTCPMSVPGRATFVCTPKKKQSRRRDTTPDG
jgi:hypothetical protein